MTNNYTFRIPEQQNLWEASRIILRRLRTLVNIPMIGINERGQSVEDFSEYDILREAMANQMAHADHFSPRRSCIHIFDDRTEFLNPGGMPMPLDANHSPYQRKPTNHKSRNRNYNWSRHQNSRARTRHPLRHDPLCWLQERRSLGNCFRLNSLFI